jgi:hypothetical protein
MSQHANLAKERWAQFDLDQQILMIASEMLRTTHVLTDSEPKHWRWGYERVLRLTDLTIAVNPRPTFRRELVCWRDLVAEMHKADAPQPQLHRSVLRVLLQLRPATALHILFLLAEERQS